MASAERRATLDALFLRCNSAVVTSVSAGDKTMDVATKQQSERHTNVDAPVMRLAIIPRYERTFYSPAGPSESNRKQHQLL
jgi:hypothetical protein